MARNFTCPTTDAPCELEACTVRRCGMADDIELRVKEARHREIGEHPERIKLSDLFDDE